MLFIRFLVLPQIFLFGTITSGSMEPTLQVGDYVICSHIRFNYIDRGDIVVADMDDISENSVIKRVIGLPGDRVDIRDGFIFINDEVYDIGYDLPKEQNISYVVPEDEYFFLGDNTRNSLDSRFWDNPYVEKDDIKYKLIKGW